jgi:hypothetical protein
MNKLKKLRSKKKEGEKSRVFHQPTADLLLVVKGLTY